MINNKTIKEEEFKQRERKIKKYSNRFLYGFIAIFLIGYGIFFSSTLWLPNTYEGVTITPIGQPVTEGDRTLTIDSWTFSKADRKMEIIAELEDLSIEGIKDYEFIVKTVEGSLKTKVIAKEDEFIIIQAEKVPKDWTEASLTMTIENENDLPENTTFTPIVIYTNNKIVNKVDTIKTKDINQYKQVAYQQRLKTYNGHIEELKVDIISLQSQITEGEKKIEELEAKLEYQTENEAMETYDTIDRMRTDIEQIKENITAKELEIQETEEKITLTNKLLNENI